MENDSPWIALIVSLVALAMALAKIITDLVKQKRAPTNGATMMQKIAHEKIDEMHRKLIPVLDNPEASAFGTLGMDQLIRDNTEAIRENARAVHGLTQLARWLYRETTGKEPPPVQ